jgi:AraC family transcriptional regulator
VRVDRRSRTVPRLRTRSTLAAAAVGELLFSPVGGAIAVYPPGSTWGPRTLHDFEFVWILEGEAVWTCNGVRHAAPPGTLILARPGTREHYRWDPSHQTRHAYVHFSIERGLERLPVVDTWPWARELPDGDILRPLFRHLLWALHHPGPGTAASIQSTLRNMLFSFLSGSMETASVAGTELPRVVNDALRCALERFERPPLRPPSVADLARAAGASPRQLHRAFQSALNCGPAAAVRLLRLDRAAFLLSDTSHDVQEIAARLGFKNQFHFSRAFKSAFGRSPTAFRARLAMGHDAPPTAILRLRTTMRLMLGE